ncbi:MAG: outer membrane beta-barrel protein [Cypionkella sp.]
MAYGMISHKLTEQLTARGSGPAPVRHVQRWRLRRPERRGCTSLALSLTYDLNQYLALETGYNYDRLDSDDADRSYSRNRVFLGVRGQF